MCVAGKVLSGAFPQKKDVKAVARAVHCAPCVGSAAGSKMSQRPLVEVTDVDCTLLRWCGRVEGLVSGVAGGFGRQRQRLSRHPEAAAAAGAHSVVSFPEEATRVPRAVGSEPEIPVPRTSSVTRLVRPPKLAGRLPEIPVL